MNLKSLISKLYHSQPLRYLASSVIAFVIDYVLLLFINGIFGEFLLAMELSAVIAWIFSSQVNFWINRFWVFKSEKSVVLELGGYYALAGVSFSVKTFVLLELMCRLLNIPLYIAKPVAEVVMYAFNFFVQKMLIFKKK